MSLARARERAGEQTEQQRDGEHDEDESGHVEHGDRGGVIALLDRRGDHHVQSSRRGRQHAPVGCEADELEESSDCQPGCDQQPTAQQRRRRHTSQRANAATVDVRADEDACQAEQGEVDTRRNAHTSDGDGHDPSGQHREDDAATDDAAASGEPSRSLRGDEGHDADRDAHRCSRSASLSEARRRGPSVVSVAWHAELLDAAYLADLAGHVEGPCRTRACPAAIRPKPLRTALAHAGTS